MTDRTIRSDVLTKARSIVVKVGTNAITGDDGRLDRQVISGLVRQVSEIRKAGVEVTLVASGAIGAGLSELNLPGRPKTMPMLQAVAAVGQGQLMRTFHDAFARHGLQVAQVLVTADDFQHRTRYLNIRNTLAALAELGAVPVINENDAVAVDEIRFGDNDTIASLVTNLLAAHALILLSNVDGVLDGGRVVDVIEEVDEATMALAGAVRSRLGSGGMATKLAAAARVTRAGEIAVIANARAPRILTRLLAGESVGTLFVPVRRRMSSRRRWIGLASRPAGKIVIDDGAVRALRDLGRSLLPSGVTAVSGRFGKGATVSVVDSAGREVAAQIARVLGDKPYDEIIHRNNMTMC